MQAPSFLIKVGERYYAQIRVPSDIAGTYGRKQHRKSLKTTDLDEAVLRLPVALVEIRAEFDKHRAKIAAPTAPEPVQQPAPIATPQSFADLGRAYGREIAARQVDALADLYEAAVANPKAFWRGEIVSLPRDPGDFTQFDRLAAEGPDADLDRVTGYVVRRRAKDRVAALRRMIANGELSELLELADTRLPGLEAKARRELARTFARSEIAALEASLSGDVETAQTATPAVPPVSAPNPIATPSTLPAISLDSLFDKWAAEAKPSASTRSTWQGHVKALKAALPAKVDDAGSITKEDVIAFKDALVAKGLASKSINDSYLAAIRTLFNYGMNNRLVESNPGDGVKVAGSKKAGASKLPYTSSEVARLLTLAKTETDPARRWLPWLAAQTGSRIGEVAQLWGRFVKQEEGVWILDIQPAPDGGSIKEEVSERQVPVHPALIADGFLDFVTTRGDGPLFYRKSSGDPTKKHASKGVTNHLGKWIRDNGFTDPRKAPNHALRHWFKTEAGRVGIDSRLVDAIQGHAPRSQGDAYYHPDLATKLAALEKIKLPPETVRG